MTPSRYAASRDDLTVVVRDYGVAAGAALGALVARYALDPLLGDHLPYVTFFVAVAGIVWWSRSVGPALAVIVLGALASEWFFSPPRYAWRYLEAQEQVSLAAYFMVTLALLGFGQALHASRRRAEITAVELDEQTEQLRITLASIGDAVISTNAEGRITTINAVAESVTGWDRDRAIGQPLDTVFRIVNEETREPVENPAARVLREGVIVDLANHTVLIARDGTERPIDDSAAPIRSRDGELVGCVLVFRDVTERRGVERKMRESDSRNSAVIHAALDCIVKIDHEGRVIEFNPAAEQAFGYRRDEVLGRQLAELIIPPSLRERHRQGMARYFATGEGPILDKRIEMIAMRADGTEFPVELTISRIPIEGPATFVAFLRDITERRHAEQLLRRSEQQNARLVQSLREADRRKNEFLAMLAHELRNPLAPIRNAVQVLRLTGSNAASVASASAMMERQIGQMVRLVDDLLDVSRISRGRIELRRGRVELASIVNHAVEAAQSLVQRMGHDLAVALPSAPIYLNADPIRLAQVLGNLLNNACKFTDAGGRISLTVEQEDGEAVIRVRDNGIGIAADQLPRIFDMFTQVDTSLERTVSGLGIGLTLVKNLVEMHDGTVSAQSGGMGHGSEFVVRLPILAATQDSRRRRSGLPSIDGAQGSPHPGRRRQPGLRRVARHAARVGGQRAPNRPRRPRSGGGRGAIQARRGPAGHRPAETQRLRRVPAHPRAAVGTGNGAGGADRLGPGGGPPPVEGAGFDGHLVKPVELADLVRLLDGPGAG